MRERFLEEVVCVIYLEGWNSFFGGRWVLSKGLKMRVSSFFCWSSEGGRILI